VALTKVLGLVVMVVDLNIMIGLVTVEGSIIMVEVIIQVVIIYLKVDKKETIEDLPNTENTGNKLRKQMKKRRQNKRRQN
jgi:hypothetical protein